MVVVEEVVELRSHRSFVLDVEVEAAALEASDRGLLPLTFECLQSFLVDMG